LGFASREYQIRRTESQNLVTASNNSRLDDNQDIATDDEADKISILNSGIVEPHCIFGVPR
jgi:hypothetical protein